MPFWQEVAVVAKDDLWEVALDQHGFVTSRGWPTSTECPERAKCWTPGGRAWPPDRSRRLGSEGPKGCVDGD
jgi:hypothetical protein